MGKAVYLAYSRNQVDGLTALAGSIQIENMHLQKNQIDDLMPLRNLSQFGTFPFFEAVFV